MFRKWIVPGVATLLVIASRWPFRSRYLFSWDSANFALALDHIDIAAHQPHPPGYLGYVWAARAINALTGNANLSLVAWNIMATVLAVLVLMRFARELSSEPDRIRTVAIAALIFVSGPLLWFYGTVAEIYPSELLVTLLIAFTAWRATRGVPGAMSWCAGAVGLGLLFKISAAVLMMPLVVYAWSRVSTPERLRSALIFVTALLAVGATFLALQPDLPTVVWNQLASATSDTRLINGDARPLRQLNRNLRDVMTALASGLGVVNLLALLVFVVAVRRLPPALGRPIVWLWATPWLVSLLGVHIGKPGYVLPLLPLLVLILATWYARIGRGAQFALVGLQLAANIAMFAWLAPPAAPIDAVPYRSKTATQKLASDLQALTFPTAETVAASDKRIAQLQDLVSTTCATGNPVIVAANGEVDWRRVMYYFPSATAIRMSGEAVLSSATSRRATAIPPSGLTVTTSCPVIWLTGTAGTPPTLTSAGLLHITASGIRVSQNAIRSVSPRPF